MTVLRANWFDFDTIGENFWPLAQTGRVLTLEGRRMQIETGPEAVGWGLGLLAALGLAFRKYIGMWIRGGAEITREKATAVLMENFRTEIERLAKLNNDLAAKLDEMQQENMMLRDEIAQLRDTINSLHNR